MEFLNQLDMNNSKVTEVATPTSTTDATNKDYVDNALALKAPLASPTFTGTVTAPTIIGDLTGTATKATGIIGSDTRYSNYAPSSYIGEGAGMSLDKTFSRGEFKSVSTMGLSSYFTGSFCYVMTHVPWSDISGGVPVQIAYGNGTPCYRKAIDSTTWGSWSALNDGGDAATSVGDASGNTITSSYASALEVTGTTVTLKAKSGATLSTITTRDTIYTHPTGDGNLHVPASGTENAGKVLTATDTAGVYEWSSAGAGSPAVVLAYW